MSVFPKVVSIEADETAGTLHVEAADCDQVRWISAPESLKPVEDDKTSDRPWRAELCRAEGQDTHRTLTNPFAITDGQSRGLLN